MKARMMFVAASLAGLWLHAAAAGPAPAWTIAACMPSDATPEMPEARIIASRLFLETGATLIWRIPGACPPDGIRISLTRESPETFHPGAMAYTRLQQGRIEVFLDRIESGSRGLRPILLGYVLAHEITHMIQATGRHSAFGVMKAHWDGADMVRMERNTLVFAQEDVDLIRSALQRRNSNR